MLVVLLAVFVLLSSFFSASETAIFGLGRIRLRQIREAHPEKFELITRFLSEPRRLLISLLIGNEIVNISITLITGAILEKSFSGNRIFQEIASILLSLLILVAMGDVTPKILAARNPKDVSLFLVPFINVFYQITRPIHLGLFIFLRKLLGDHNKTNNRFDEADLVEIMSHAQGDIHPSEKKLIEGALGLDDRFVQLHMTPREKVIGVPKSAHIRDAIEIAKQYGFRRLPVFDSKHGDPIGILLVKDLVPFINGKDLDRSIQSLVKPPIFVSANQNLSQVFRKLKRERFHLAVVLSPLGEFVGLITLDDILRYFLRSPEHSA